jgi:hypothetical protein
MAHSQDRLDLFRRSGQQHSLRNDAEIRQPIALIGLQFFLRCDQATVSADGAEFLEDAGVHEISVWAAASRGAATPGEQRSAWVHKRQTRVGREVGSCGRARLRPSRGRRAKD